MRNLGWGGVALACVLAISGCTTGSDAAKSDGGGGESVDDVEIVMLLNDQFDPYYLTLVEGAQERADRLGIDFSWQAPNTLDVASQTQLLQSIASRQPDGIIMSALDAEALVGPMKSVMAQGTEIVTVDADVNDPSARLATFTSHGADGGALAAETMSKLLDDTGKVGYVGYTPGIASIDARKDGWQDGLADTSLTDVGEQYAGADVSENATKTSSLISRDSDIRGIFASWTNATVGAAQAVRQAGAKDVSVIGFDASPEEVGLLRNGDVDALIVQKAREMGSDAIQALTDYVTDGTEPKDENLYDFVVATPDNLDDPKVQKYLYVDPEGK